MIRSAKVIILICVLFLLVCCSNNTEVKVIESQLYHADQKVDNNDSAQRINKNENKDLDTEKELPNPFDVNSARVNDKVCGMTIKEITDNANIIHFSGQVTISGEFKHEDDEIYFGKIISFIPDDSSILIIPKLKDDNRLVWFVFSNYEEASKELGRLGCEGEATIVIDEYMIDANAIETYNEAKLVKVIDKQSK